MTIYVQMKQIGKRKGHIRRVPLEYKTVPENVRELIEETVKIMIEHFLHKAEADAERQYSKEEIEDMAEIGKIAFGLYDRERLPEEKEAVSMAVSAYEDGLVRIFAGEEEAVEIDSPLSLKEGDEIVFIKMTFLAGRMW